MLDTARSLGDDGYNDEAECLRASAGALYWAVDVDHESLYSPEAFLAFMSRHVGWDQGACQDALEEVTQLVEKYEQEVQPLPEPPSKPVKTRFKRTPLV